MLAMPNRTPYDLNFRVLGIPVQVHPMFWLVTAILGYEGRPPASLLVWVACVFVSILVHELGHGLMGRAFGGSPWIALYGMGGLCSSEGQGTLGRRLAVILAGPGAGFLLFGLVYLAGSPLLARVVPAGPIEGHGPGLLLIEAYGDLLLINLVWNILNLLPIWPMDGGQALGAILQRLMPWRGQYWTHVVGLVLATLIVLLLLRIDMGYNTFLFAYFAFANFQGMQANQVSGWGRRDDDDDYRRWRG